MPDGGHSAQRVQLQEERQRVQDQLAELRSGPNAALDFDGGFADSSQVTAERAELEALAVTLGETLDEVDEALRKLDDGTYGRCEDCGNPITEARLEAMPTARLCIACASKSR
jgi:RNA polymerase-binding transcription factor DksA